MKPIFCKFCKRITPHMDLGGDIPEAKRYVCDICKGIKKK